MKDSFLENKYVELWIEDGIIFEVFKPSVKEVTLEIAKEVVNDRLKVSNEITRPMLIDMGNFRIIEKNARDYFGGKESNSYVSAAAIVLNSYIAWLAGKLFLSFNKPSSKIELFKTRHKAVEWLKQFR